MGSRTVRGNCTPAESDLLQSKIDKTYGKFFRRWIFFYIVLCTLKSIMFTMRVL